MNSENGLLPPVQRLLNELHASYAGVAEGNVATYIPELSLANPEWFGIALVTLDGHTYAVGDCDVPFTIQSISKPFVYGLALEDNGEDYVLSRVGLEPSGDAFNAISLDPGSGRPSNPMINAGAIATAGLVKAGDSDPLTRMLRMFETYTGRALTIDDAVRSSESETGHRNRAIGHLLRNFDIVDSDPEAVLDLYFRQCSISVTCRDLALMGACLANGGVNPVTGERAIRAEHVSRVLSVMGSCGMYNYAGEWIYRVGMPAKSGVAGGVLASLVGQLGIGVFSPRLDARGNSVRGVLVCDSLSRAYSLNMLNVPNVSRSGVRAAYGLTEVRSKRRRSAEASVALHREGERARVYELQGQLNFASVERFSRDAVERADEIDAYAIDFKRATGIDAGAIELLCNLLEQLCAAGEIVALADAEHLPGFGERVEALAATHTGLRLVENRDEAIEWCEDRLLETLGVPEPASVVALEENEFFDGLDVETIAALMAVAKQMSAPIGARIMNVGDSATSVFLLVRGSVSVTIDLPDSEVARLATYSAGMAFGQSALVGETVRTADVTADSEVEYFELRTAEIEALGRDDPRVLAAVYRNVARDLASELRMAGAEIRALAI
ncbi:MAG: glutaminase A [Chloroflexota bacterium]